MLPHQMAETQIVAIRQFLSEKILFKLMSVIVENKFLIKKKSVIKIEQGIIN